MILIHSNKEYLSYCKSEIQKWFEKLGLKMNIKKTQLFKIKQGIRFLGFRFCLSDTGKVIMTLLPEKISHERRKLKKLVQRAKSGKMTKLEVYRCYSAWRSYASNQHKKGTCRKKAHRNTHNLILCMDKYYKELWR